MQSAIHPALIALNFLHLTEEVGYDYLFTINVPHKNAGRVTDGFLKRYKHVELGGLWISGLDPLNNWAPSDWGRFKPTYPRINSKGKLIKYESQPGVSNRVTYFNVPYCIWDLIAQQYGIKRYHSSLARRLQDKFDALVFWEWVKKHPEIPIILCEGEKKAACLLSMGFVAIALPGIWNGRVGKKDFDERLHPDLIPMCQKGRKFIILFDYESKQNTRWSVYQATLRTGEAIEATGCTCEVALLPGPEKGVDDFIVARAANEDANKLLTSIIDDAKSLKDYRYWFFRKKRGLSQLYPADITVNVKFLTEALGFEANEYKNGGRPIYWYEGKNPSALVARIAASIMLAKKVMVVSDSKRFIKKLQILLTNQKIKCKVSDVTSDIDTSDNGANTEEASGIKIWSIHSDNSGSEENVAFIENIASAVKDVEVLLTSPSLGTGVDIPEYYFDAVFGIFHASSQTATECVQQL